jgi:hypothetical protein
MSMYRYTPLLLIGIIPMMLVSCGKDDSKVWDPATVVAAKEYPTYTREQLEAMSAEAAKKVFSANSGSTDDLTSYLQGGGRNIRELIESLTGSDATTVAKKAYLKSYMGDYSGAFTERDTLCKTDTTQCAKYGITLNIASTRDQSGTIISAPNIYLDGKSLSVESSIVQPKTYDDMVHRVRVEKEWYLDAYQKLDGAEAGIKNFEVNPVMAKADLVVEMDNQLGGTYSVQSLTSSGFTYIISPDTFVTSDGKLVKGKVDVYLFWLEKADNSLSSFQLDVFSENGTSLWSRMITDGMPFVTAYQDGKELTIWKSIVGTGTVDSLRIRAWLKSVPKNQWLTPNELQQHGLPGFWRLDRSSGIWVESKMQILNETGTYMFNFQ